ncbi:MAG: hypothetical protein M3N34_08305 [Pseudomonadota bacterium]|nr:hypothetical protein [Pseudomonadota bacterium]
MTVNIQPYFSQRYIRRALALAASTTALALSAAPANAKEQPGAPKISLSAKFGPVYSDFAKKLEADKARPDILAAQQAAKAVTTEAQQKAAQIQLAGLVAAEKAQLPSVVAAAVTPDDHYAAGQLELTLGGIALDTALQRQALLDMIATGKVGPADTAKFQFYIGNFARDAGDYPAAITALQAAIAAGYTENQIDVLLADTYLKNHQIDKGLPALQHAIDVQKASGQPVPVSWYRSGVVAAYNAKLVGPTLSFGTGLIQQEPTQKNWSLLLQVVQRVAGYSPQEELDLMRLMGRTHSYGQKEDYLEYIQDADARRFPGEVLDVIAAGVASGMLHGTETSIVEAKAVASSKVTADRASLPSLFRDGRAPGASAATTSAAADAALSYGQAAEALALYKIALDKPGVETARVLTRMGIAQIDTGDYTGAQATFARITGPRVPLAKLWTIYAAEKAGGK